MKKKFIIILLSIVCLFFLGYNFLPHFLSKYSNYKTFKNLNLEVKRVKYGDNYFEYVEGGEGPTILFVHGFKSSKNQWASYMKKFKGKYHIVALDLPGHGKSPASSDQKYDLISLTTSLSVFIEKKDLNNINIVGTSMGGGIVSLYAYYHPEKLDTLVLINPLGIDRGYRSDLQLLIDQGKNLLFPNSLSEFDEMAIFLTGKEIKLSPYFKRYALEQMMKEYKFAKEAFNQLLSSKPLDDVLPKIKTKTLILIAQKDKIIHPETFEIFVKLVPNIKAIRLENANHVLIDQHLDKATNEIDEFIQK